MTAGKTIDLEVDFELLETWNTVRGLSLRQAALIEGKSRPQRTHELPGDIWLMPMPARYLVVAEEGVIRHGSDRSSSTCCPCSSAGCRRREGRTANDADPPAKGLVPASTWISSSFRRRCRASHPSSARADL